MRTRLTLHDELLAKAQRLTGLKETSEVVHAGLRALIVKRSAERLAEMGGSDPGAGAPPRRPAKRANRDAFRRRAAALRSASATQGSAGIDSTRTIRRERNTRG